MMCFQEREQETKTICSPGQGGMDGGLPSHSPNMGECQGITWDYWGSWEPPTFQSPVFGQLMERAGEVPRAWVWARHSRVCALVLSLSDTALPPGAVLGIRHRTDTALPPSAPESLVDTPGVTRGCIRSHSWAHQESLGGACLSGVWMWKGHRERVPRSLCDTQHHGCCPWLLGSQALQTSSALSTGYWAKPFWNILISNLASASAEQGGAELVVPPWKGCSWYPPVQGVMQMPQVLWCLPAGAEQYQVQKSCSWPMCSKKVLSSTKILGVPSIHAFPKTELNQMHLETGRMLQLIRAGRMSLCSPCPVRDSAWRHLDSSDAIPEGDVPRVPHLGIRLLWIYDKRSWQGRTKVSQMFRMKEKSDFIL